MDLLSRCAVSLRIESELLATKGMTQNDFQNTLLNFQNEPRVQEAFYGLQMENKRIMESHGISMM
jgi:hypothetical protein